jgi:tRNA(Leu) C34 or U34 (ribose-2'-O)-methylase TrmL
MDSFPLSEKRLASMPAARRHKWVADWLRKIYSNILDRRCSEKSLDIFFASYLKIRACIGAPAGPAPKPSSERKWLEFVSQCFHEHRKLSGKGLSEPNFLPRVSRGDRTGRGPWKPSIAYRVALDNMRSAFNVGSVLRVADAVGFESALLSAKTPGSENLQVVKTSMGCAAWIPQQKYVRLHAALHRARMEGYSVIGIETIPESNVYTEFAWPEKAVVVLGNEEYGISEDVLRACDAFVHLPMRGFKNSVNVANAFAVVAFHIAALYK